MAVVKLAEPRSRAAAAESQVEAGSYPLPARFDLDAFHAMQARDDSLVAERALTGVAGKIFVYDFTISGQRVTGVSVEGAEELASYYKGIKHRIVASAEKKGAVFTFRSYPGPDVPMAVSVNVVNELEDEPDFYSALVEVTDVKSGNSYQAEVQEFRFEKKRDGTFYERPNFQRIAQSKARRNAILMCVPKAVQEQFKQRCLASGAAVDISADVFTSKRKAVLQYAASKGIALDRSSLERISLEQIAGLSESVKDGPDAFKSALAAVGLASAEEVDPNTGEVRELPKPQAKVQEPAKQQRPPAPKPAAQEAQVSPDAASGQAGTDGDGEELFQ